MILRELIAKIGFKVDTKELDKFDKSITGLKTKLKNITSGAKIAAAALVATTGAMTALTVSTANSIKVTAQLSKQLGVNADDLRSLEETAQAAGLGTDQLTNSLIRFDVMLGQAKISSKGTSNEFKALGINIQANNGTTKDSVTLFAEASRKILSLKDPARQAAISYRLFGTSNLETARFMGQSNDAILDQVSRLRALTYEIDHNAIASSERFARSWSETKTVFKSVKEQLAIELMPVLDELLTNFKDWFIINKDLIKQNISATVAFLSKSFSFLSSVIGFVLKPIKIVINALGGLESALSLASSIATVLFIPKILSAAKAMKVFTLALLANPIIAITTAVIALGVAITALVLEDIAFWVNGNNSAIGKILGSWIDFKDQVLTLWGILSDGIMKILVDIKDFGSNIFDSMIDSVSNLGAKLKDLIVPDIFKSKDVETNVVNNVLTKRKERVIRLIDESTIDSDKSLDINDPKVTVVNRTPKVEDKTLTLSEKIAHVRAESRAYNGIPLDGVIPSKAERNILPINNDSISPKSRNIANNTENKVTQNITENITINVPAGTTSEQSRDISSQVASQVRQQFEVEMIRGLDSMSAR